MSRLDFRIDWGYQYLYSRRQYHPVFDWSGSLSCSNARIEHCFLLEYPPLIYGPGHCAKEIPLDSPQWHTCTRRKLAGIRVESESGPDGEFLLRTNSCDLIFSAAELRAKGCLRFPVGPKYLGCSVIVTRKNFLWFRPPPAPDSETFEAADLPLPCHDWNRMCLAFLAPGKRFTIPFTVPERTKTAGSVLLHLEVMGSPCDYTPEGERVIHDYFEIAVSRDGNPPEILRRYLREHDGVMQMLEDVFCSFDWPPGKHRLTLENLHPGAWLLFSRIVLQYQEQDHLDVELPPWALAGETLFFRVFSIRSENTEFSLCGKKHIFPLVPGWNEFPFTAPAHGPFEIVSSAGTNTLSAIYPVSEENPPVTVGCDMTVVPHDDTGVMDRVLEYLARTRMGNLSVFRSFLTEGPNSTKFKSVPDELLRKWGVFCRGHRIYVEAATDFENGVLAEAAGPFFHSAGRHEFPGAVYARNPEAPWASDDMKTASERYIAYLTPQIQKANRFSRSAFGDAGGGARYCFLAGMDFLRAETMVGHTQHICSLARPASEVFQSGEWGVHIAMQHAFQPHSPAHLRQYFLSLFQPWMMGAKMFYEEDSLFLMFKEERQCADDALTRGKREITSAFFRFAKTHPRHGRCVRKIAFLEGRYAAPFNGFICGGEQDPHYSVWGRFGNPAPEWGHDQPEKCRQLLDVLMPGASTHPLRQKPEKRRFYFSGTPFGDFDQTPIEAPAEFLAQYALLLNLGWNTMIPSDYEKLRAYVSQGGILLTGIPQFSTHVKRDFLRSMDDLALFRSGTLSDLCGIRVRGRGPVFSGSVSYSDGRDIVYPELSALPSDSPDEDGPAYTADCDFDGAEVIASDTETGVPLLAARRVGKGTVYTLLFMVYPGHEKIQKFCASQIVRLAARLQGNVTVDDPSREVFHTRWRCADNSEILMLLNTDWTTPGNRKNVVIHAPCGTFPLSVPEGVPVRILLTSFAAVVIPTEAHFEPDSDGGFFSGLGEVEFKIFHAGAEKTVSWDFRAGPARFFSKK